MEHEIDGWIEQLSQCKQLTEPDVKKLCDKVDNSRHRLVSLFLSHDFFFCRRERS